ncbi:MAG: hypothetical protein ACYC7F_03445 [Gemmatimonadaceae bacterium]
MPTPLSSRWTPFYKFVLPLLVVGGIGVGAFVARVHPEGQNLPPGFRPEHTWYFMLAVAGVVATIMWWTVGNLTRIELDDDDLVISNYRTEIRVPLAEIEKISGPSMSNPQRYTITFAEATELGRRVTFMPPMVWSLMRGGEREEVAELRRAWEAARAKAGTRR